MISVMYVIAHFNGFSTSAVRLNLICDQHQRFSLYSQLLIQQHEGMRKVDRIFDNYCFSAKS